MWKDIISDQNTDKHTVKLYLWLILSQTAIKYVKQGTSTTGVAYAGTFQSVGTILSWVTPPLINKISTQSIIIYRMLLKEPKAGSLSVLSSCLDLNDHTSTVLRMQFKSVMETFVVWFNALWPALCFMMLHIFRHKHYGRHSWMLLKSYKLAFGDNVDNIFWPHVLTNHPKPIFKYSLI